MKEYWNIWDYQDNWVDKCIAAFRSNINTRLCMDVHTEHEAKKLAREAIAGGLEANYRYQKGAIEESEEFYTISFYYPYNKERHYERNRRYSGTSNKNF